MLKYPFMLSDMVTRFVPTNFLVFHLANANAFQLLVISNLSTASVENLEPGYKKTSKWLKKYLISRCTHLYPPEL